MFYFRVPALAILLVGLMALTGGSAQAQSGRAEFQGVGIFKIKTAGFGQAAEDCGLTPQAASDAFASALKSAGAQVLDRTTAYWLSLRVTTLIKDGELCVTYVETAANQTARYWNSATLTERVGNVQHWINGGLYASTPKQHRLVVNGGFRELGEKLAVRWRRDQ